MIKLFDSKMFYITIIIFAIILGMYGSISLSLFGTIYICRKLKKMEQIEKYISPYNRGVGEEGMYV